MSVQVASLSSANSTNAFSNVEIPRLDDVADCNLYSRRLTLPMKSKKRAGKIRQAFRKDKRVVREQRVTEDNWEELLDQH